MTRRAFVHVGLPKTGTTYLQGVVWANKEPLAERGLLVPGRHHRRHMLASLDLREDPTLARRAGDVEHPWSDLVEEAAAWPGDVLISHEFLGAASPPQVERLVRSLGTHEVHAVVTARPLTELTLSMWQQWVKSGGRLSIDDFPKSGPYSPTDGWGWGCFDLADVLERWSSVIDPERLHVLPLDRGRHPSELWTRFAGVLGVDGADLTIPEEVANPTLGLVEVELLRRVNPHLREFTTAAGRGHWIRGKLAEGGVLPRTGERFTAGPEKLAELVERGERSLKMLREGGYDVVGDLALLEPVVPQGLRHPSEVSDAEMLDSAASAIAALLGDVRMLTRELRDVRREHEQIAAESERTRPRRFSRLRDRYRRGRSHHV